MIKNRHFRLQNRAADDTLCETIRNGRSELGVDSRNRMIGYFAEACALPPGDFYFCGTETMAPHPRYRVAPNPMRRIFLPLAGEKHMIYAEGGRWRNRRLRPGDMLTVPAYGWCDEVWDSPHRMVCVVFHRNFTRFLFLEHDGIAPRPPGPDVFFHTPRVLCREGNLTLEALLAAGKDSPSARLNLRALLEILKRELEAAEPGEVPRREEQWGRLEAVLHECFQSQPTREEIAESAQLHPAQVSRLIRDFGHASLTGYLNELRLDYAAELLRGDELTVGEVAEMSGFAYPGYFIRLFRKRWEITPAEYRRRLKSRQ